MELIKTDIIKINKALDLVKNQIDKSDIVIYPYGQVGKYVEKIAKEHGLNVARRIDNKAFDGHNIFNIEQSIDFLRDSNCIIVLCTLKEEIAYLLFENLKGNVNEDRIVQIIDTTRARTIYQVEEQFKDKKLIYRKAKSLAQFWEEKQITNDGLVFAGSIEPGTAPDMLPLNLNDNIALLHDKLHCGAYDELLKMEQLGLVCSNMGNHAIPAYDQLIKKGLQYFIDKYETGLKELHQENSNCDRNVLYSDSDVADNTYSKIDFYEAELTLLKGFQKYIRRYENAYKDINPDISKVCRKISSDVPTTFREALQLVLFAHSCIVSEAGCGSMSFGRVDQYLYPYYQHDIENGVIDRTQAQELITEFWKKVSELAMSWQNITIGGSDKDGNDMCNELTEMCLEAAQIVHADQPQLSLRVSSKMPDKIWKKALKLIASGGGFPSLYNDDVCIKAKLESGYDKEDAFNYAVMGCVELMAGGKDYSHTEGARINVAKLLPLIMGYGCQDNTLEHVKPISSSISSFEDFYDYYCTQLANVINYVCDFLDVLSNEYPKRWPVPFLSCFMDRCFENGRDVTDNGTKYNNLTINIVGFGTAVDSLQAIKELCFEWRKYTLAEIIEALKNDFLDTTNLQEEMKNCEKYGNDKESVDAIAQNLTSFITDKITKYKLRYRKGMMQVGFYTSYFHSDFGKLTEATPDGRNAYKALSPSYSASSGMDTCGPLALCNSATKSSMISFSNGMALDVKFVRSFFDKQENVSAIKSMILGYFKKGGMEIQINVVDPDELKDAYINPDRHSNLVVRVAGFSAYFVMLDKELQLEIIKRTANQVV